MSTPDSGFFGRRCGTRDPSGEFHHKSEGTSNLQCSQHSVSMPISSRPRQGASARSFVRALEGKRFLPVVPSFVLYGAPANPIRVSFFGCPYPYPSSET